MPMFKYFQGLISVSESSSYIFPSLTILLLSWILISRGVVRNPFLSSPAVKTAVKSTHGVERASGEWDPVNFNYPPIKPCEKELKDIKPIPYRPFRWGTYSITMGIRPMPWDDWIELDNQYERYQRIRAHRIRSRGDKIIRVLDDDANPGVVKGAGEAAVELVHELAEYLFRRYPQTFSVERLSSKFPHSLIKAHGDWGWEGAPAIKKITCLPSKLTYELPLSVDDGVGAPERALKIAAMLIQDDLAIMIEGVDRKYYFQAAAVCIPGSWRMEDKIGLPLSAIHTYVPHYKEKLHISLERFFPRLAVDKPVIRNNYIIQIVPPQNISQGDEISSEASFDDVDPEELAWSEVANGPEDGYGGQRTATRVDDRPIPTPDIIRIRTERQTLRRLPRSGAVVFTIRTYVYPVVELAQERGVPGRIASSMRAWTEDIAEYKGRERGKWGDVLLKYLDECHQRQIDNGEVQEGEKVGEGLYPM